jgi:hypothetical protein
MQLNMTMMQQEITFHAGSFMGEAVAQEMDQRFEDLVSLLKKLTDARIFRKENSKHYV